MIQYLLGLDWSGRILVGLGALLAGVGSVLSGIAALRRARQEGREEATKS